MIRFALAFLLPGLLAATLAAQDSGPRQPVLKQSTWRVTYPSEAVRKEQEGRVTFVLTIDEGGRVTNCVVKRSSRHRLIDEAACQTGRSASFEPALDANGVATTGTYDTTLTYNLN